jgi:hypothetical protein
MDGIYAGDETGILINHIVASISLVLLLLKTRKNQKTIPQFLYN